MSVKELPINYKLFSKVEKSMTKATKIITNLYGVMRNTFFFFFFFFFFFNKIILKLFI